MPARSLGEVAGDPDFEIIPGPGEPADEELPNPGPRSSSRLRVVAAVLVAAAVVALVAFRVASGHHGAPAAAPPLHPPGSRRDAVSHPSDDLSGAPRTVPPPFTCPAGDSPGSGCVISHSVSPPVAAAIRARFPRAHHIRQFDVALRGDLSAARRLIYRKIQARVNRVQITITVSRHKITVPEEVAKAPNILSYSYYARGGLHVTSVGVAVGYRWRLLPATRMFALTADPRLRAAAS